MKRTKRLMATMILAAVATLGTPQAYAGIMIGDRAAQNTENGSTRSTDGIMIGDYALHVFNIVGIMIGDITGHMLDD